jgi:hypothetical protein
MKHIILPFLVLAAFICCKKQEVTVAVAKNIPPKKAVELPVKQSVAFDSLAKTLHVFVALCDNKYQGIVPVPARIGNGQDPNTNLYWGCGYGIRTYFKKSGEWKLVQTLKPRYPCPGAPGV